MTTNILVCSTWLAGVLLFLPPGAAAQAPSTPVRGDATGVIAWQFASSTHHTPYSRRRWEGNLFGGGIVGLHWTDHHRTEVDAGVSTTGHTYRTRELVIGGRPLFGSSRLAFSRRTIGIGQQYQFFRNAWFHPHVGAGINLRWERRVEEFLPVAVYDPAIRTGRIVQPGRTEGPSTVFVLRPYAEAGFKAYMTRRTFFRGDARVVFDGRPDEVLLRAGFGVDF